MAKKKKGKRKDLELSKGRMWWRHSILRRMWKPMSGLVWGACLWCIGKCVKVYFWLMQRGLTTERDGPLFEYIREGKPCIIAIWHDDPFPCMVELFRHTQNYPVVAMASGGRTGRLGSYLLGLWGIKAVHGSSSGGGIEAVERLTRKVNKKHVSVIMTADGSRGPLHAAKWGAIYLAKDTGLPIIGYRGWSQRNVRLNWSWTKLALPIPWGRYAAISVEPLFVPAEADKEELDRCRLELERRMRAQVERATKMVKGELV